MLLISTMDVTTQYRPKATINPGVRDARRSHPRFAVFAGPRRVRPVQWLGEEERPSRHGLPAAGGERGHRAGAVAAAGVRVPGPDRGLARRGSARARAG